MTGNSERVIMSLKRFPAIVEIFIYFFYSLLFLGEICNHYEETVPMESIYDFLTSYFDMEVEFGDSYVHLVNSNMCVF